MGIEENLEEIEEIFDKLEYKINKHINETNINEQDDLSQEIKILIINKTNKFPLEEAPGFIEYAEMI